MKKYTFFTFKVKIDHQLILSSGPLLRKLVALPKVALPTRGSLERIWPKEKWNDSAKEKGTPSFQGGCN